TAGLLWVAVLLATVLAVQRSATVETADRAMDAMRLSGLEPAGVFLGKAAALALQLVVLEALLAVGVVVLYDAPVQGGGVARSVVTAVATPAGLASTGTLYGALAAGAKVRDTLPPLLLLPVVAPVLIGATRATEAALGTGGATTSDGWPWVGLLAVFALAYSAVGLLAYGSLMEDA